MVTEIAVVEMDAGLRLDRWIRLQVGPITQSRLERMCRRGQLRVDGHRVRCSTRLAAGQVVRMPRVKEDDRSGRPSAEKQQVDQERLDDLRSSFVYEDETIVAINKQPGLATQGGTGQRVHLDLLLDNLDMSGDQKLRLVHRLDKETSGVLILAKSAAAARAMTGIFRDRQVTKRYFAVTIGCPDPASGLISYKLGKESGGRHGVTWYREGDQEVSLGAMNARTSYHVLETAAGGTSLVILEPGTGRKHQLRAHMAAIDCPIVGDDRYGPPAGKRKSIAGFGVMDWRLHLHARCLEFIHPFEERPVSIRAAFPDHMMRTFEHFGWNIDDHA